MEGVSGTDFDTGDYAYDGAGNVTAIGTSSFAYDPVSRLTDATVNSAGVPYTRTYEYDAKGNLQRMTEGGVVREHWIGDSHNNLQDWPDRPADYDDRQNLSRWAQNDGDGTWFFDERYEWDALNKLVWRQSIDNNSGGQVIENEWHVYTADDERLATIEAHNNFRTTWTVRDLNGKVLRELIQEDADSDGEYDDWSRRRDYIYREGMLLASEEPGVGTKHYHLDHLGTPRLITSASGAPVSWHDYYPFGEEITLPTQEVMKFTGHERDFHQDPETDLDYMHARYCSPYLGRFLSWDPKVLRTATKMPQEWNRYGYALNNPLAYNDPDGLRQNPVTGKRGVGGPAYGAHGEIRASPSNREIGRYGMTRTDSRGQKKPHRGLDLNAKKGSPLKAAESGTITRLGNFGVAGNILVITTPDGTTLSYVHLDGFATGLSVGSEVQEGQLVGFAGTTGNAEGIEPNQEHLHFAVNDPDGKRRDPEEWLNDPEAPDPVDYPPQEREGQHPR